MSGSFVRQPPRFVPTLTDVVTEPSVEPQKSLEQAVYAPDEKAPPSESTVLPSGTAEQSIDWDAMAEELQRRLMHRVDAILSEHVQYALTEIVQAHTQALYEAIHRDVQEQVRSTVRDAIREEINICWGTSRVES